ncbi:ACP S-malonyltransferase [Porcipelethomonas sp.]|uniref:ACP S-malonyltransferase n=1 Tax=Porcipelethomonas sp. TaxID=2981675 RepID=UPI003EF7CDF2
MTVFLFSGQGSQYPGMGKELLEANPEFSFIYDKASEILGFDLKKVTFEGTEEELARTCYSQPAIMAMSLLCFEAAKKYGISFDAVAGHSLGEYAAMTASGILTLEDGFKVIKARAAAMDKAGRETQGAMYAIMKMTPEEIEKICEETPGYVVPVNYNSPVQTVIAGEKDAAAKAVETFAQKGARAVPLKVSAAFHSKLMEGAAKEFYEAVKDISFNKPSVPFYSNVTGEELKDFSDMPSLLAKHMVSPVRFTSELNAMSNAGFDKFIELGPNKVLTGLVKKTLKGAAAANIENLKTLEAALTL